MTILASSYNYYLIALSILIAGLASYTTLDLVGRITATEGRARVLWLLSGAIAMGTGIWSMHFIGMLAVRMPMTVRYDVHTVVLSILPAILASGLSLVCVSRTQVSIRRLTVSSLLLAAGIVTMHYVGMAAMRLDAVIHYNPKLVISSVLIAIVVSWVGLYFAITLRRETTTLPLWKKGIAACIMGAAIPTMHYTGMAAAQFTALDTHYQTGLLKPANNALILTIAVSIGSVILLGLTILTAVFERRLAAQTLYAQAIQESQKYLHAILQGVQVGVVVVEKEQTIKGANQAALDLLQLSTVSELQAIWTKATSTDAGDDSADPPIEPALDSDLSAMVRSLKPILQNGTTHQSIQNAIIYIDAENNEPSVINSDLLNDEFQTNRQTDGKTALLVNAVSLTSYSSETPQMVYTFSDISELKQTEESLQKSEAHAQRLARQETLFGQITNRIRRSLNLSDTLQTTVREVRKFFNTERALIYQFDAQWRGKVVWEDAVAPWPSTLGKAADNCFPKVCLERYRNGYIRAIDNVATEPLTPSHREFLQNLQVQANLIAPIMVSDRLWGLLIIHQCSHPRIWTESEGTLLHRLAIQLGIAIQQAELYAQAEQSAVQAQLQADQLRASEEELQQQVQARQKALQELQKIQVQLVQSEKMSMIGQLVAGIAHEINNPVNFIYGNLVHVENYSQHLLHLIQLYQTNYPTPAPDITTEIEAVELDFLQEDLPKILTSMQVGAERIRQIVLSLRNFARMDEAELKEVDIHEGIDSTLLMLQHRLKEKNGDTHIRVTRDYTTVPKVFCYPGKLNQVFMNILTNAIDALESVPDPPLAPMEITIQTSLISKDISGDISGDISENFSGNTGETQHQQKDTRRVRIAISDNGPGIPEHIQHLIFDPFFTTKPVGEGTGLGMSISYQIISEVHDGQLTCISKPNEGTTFVIELPLECAT